MGLCKCKAWPFPHRDTDKKCQEQNSEQWFDLTDVMDFERRLFDREEAKHINDERVRNERQ